MCPLYTRPLMQHDKIYIAKGNPVDTSQSEFAQFFAKENYWKVIEVIWENKDIGFNFTKPFLTVTKNMHKINVQNVGSMIHLLRQFVLYKKTAQQKVK